MNYLSINARKDYVTMDSEVRLEFIVGRDYVTLDSKADIGCPQSPLKPASSSEHANRCARTRTLTRPVGLKLPFASHFQHARLGSEALFPSATGCTELTRCASPPLHVRAGAAGDWRLPSPRRREEEQAKAAATARSRRGAGASKSRARGDGASTLRRHTVRRRSR
jgi:hypothetical protein